MIFNFNTPQILDSTDFLKQIRPDGISAGDYTNIVSLQKFREFFKRTVEEIIIKASSPENPLEKARKDLDTYFQLQLHSVCPSV